MSSHKTTASRLMDRYYPVPNPDPLDVAFCAHARAGMKVLDAGCSGSRGCSRQAPWEEMFIVGIDIDPAVKNNPFCNETYICDLSKPLPFDDSSFDIIHCRWVIEHLEYPEKTFHEFHRVLKPGGKVLCLTPNLFHYAMIAARITPYWFHRWWKHEEDGEAFPTYYRANSPRSLRRLCTVAGFKVQRLELMEVSPYYLIRHWPLFLCGVLYERIVNSTSLFERMRQRIVLEAEKPL